MNFKIKNKKEYPLICFYSHCEPKKRANAIFLICAWQVLYSIIDCLRALAKARKYNFFDYKCFKVDAYEYFEQVEVSQPSEITPTLEYTNKALPSTHLYHKKLKTFASCAYIYIMIDLPLVF